MGSAKKKSNDCGIQKVAGQELREYLKLPVDHELPPHGGEVRVLPDGRVLYKLVAEKRSATTWPSREAYTEWWRNAEEEVAKARSAPHPTVALLPPIDDFLRDVEEHAKSLGSRLNIPDEALDGSVASLGIVDKALKRIPLAERPVADLVTPLVAYVGEVLRKATAGRWIKLRPPSNEPMVTANNGQSFEVFADVFIPMIEPSKRNPLRPTIEARLHGAGYPQAPKPTT
jgi:hypothetical protein